MVSKTVSFQHVINIKKLGDILLFFFGTVFEIWHVFYAFNTSQFQLATVQGLSKHVATKWDSTALDGTGRREAAEGRRNRHWNLVNICCGPDRARTSVWFLMNNVSVLFLFKIFMFCCSSWFFFFAVILAFKIALQYFVSRLLSLLSPLTFCAQGECLISPP